MREQAASWQAWRKDLGDTVLILGFSGGGTRAAAFSYGVLRELRDTEIPGSKGQIRLLDEVDGLTSVSGGSFTSAYYALYGDKIFDSYESVFLRRDVQDSLLDQLLRPTQWFSPLNRTERAIEFYDQQIFDGATFADLNKPGKPFLVINATDLGNGNRFPFTPDMFSVICSDLSQIKLARAVAASSAVPVVFAPVVLRNHTGCDVDNVLKTLGFTSDTTSDNVRVQNLLETVENYRNKSDTPYIHLIDGGISDNLGLRVLHDRLMLKGGTTSIVSGPNYQPPRRIAVILVNAQTRPGNILARTPEEPSIADTIGAVTDAQIARYNIETVDLATNMIKSWETELSTPEQTVKTYFINLNFSTIESNEKRRTLNQTATSFALSDEEVDNLLSAASELLRNSPQFHELLSDIKADYQSDQ